MTERLFRLLIAGDPHICDRDADVWSQAIVDINHMGPQATLVLGDLTGGSDMGSTESLTHAVTRLNQLQSPWRSIIGNHDLQWKGHASDTEAVADFLRLNQRETPWFRWDLPHLSILGLSNTVHRDGVVSQEIVLIDEQLDWLDAQLATMQDRPVILAIHAPPVGSGVVQLAELHAHTGNALVNQNHRPSSVMKRIWQSPNVLMSFSGHNHLGQHYRDALSIRIGVHFIHTGVIGRHTRDGFRHSRVLDIYADHFELLTFDHSLGRIDHDLTYRSKHSLHNWLTYRRNNHLSRAVPANPTTMRQGPDDGPVSLGEMRFAVLNDAHWSEFVQPIQKRTVEWANAQCMAHGAKHLLLNGDLSHHASASEVNAFVNHLSRESVKHLIPGNNEGLPLPAVLESTSHMRLYSQRVQRLQDWPGEAWALAITRYKDLPEAIEALAAQLPQQGHVLVAAHMAPKHADDAMFDALHRPGLHVHWISGHEHISHTRQINNVTLHIVAGLDPIKVQATLPEILLGVWDGRSLRLERRIVPQKMLAPSSPATHLVGIAYLGTPEEILADAVEYDIPAVQFRDIEIKNVPLFEQLLNAFRLHFPQGRLSVHLPTPTKDEDGPGMGKVEHFVQWAIQYGMDDWTIHMPGVYMSMLYTDSGSFQQTSWAKACLSRYVALARSAVDAKAQLSLENVNNNHTEKPDQALLSSSPWHVTTLIKYLRQALLDSGYASAQAERVGMIFDTGHAFTDPMVSKTHGLCDWVHLTAEYIQMAHIHQVMRVNEKYKRHTRISTEEEGRINHAGLLSLLQENLTRPIVLLAEVRERQDAIHSAKTMQAVLSKNQRLIATQ